MNCCLYGTLLHRSCGSLPPPEPREVSGGFFHNPNLGNVLSDHQLLHSWDFHDSLCRLDSHVIWDVFSIDKRSTCSQRPQTRRRPVVPRSSARRVMSCPGIHQTTRRHENISRRRTHENPSTTGKKETRFVKMCNCVDKINSEFIAERVMRVTENRKGSKKHQPLKLSKIRVEFPHTHTSSARSFQSVQD